MLAKQLLNRSITPLLTSDTVSSALEMMNRLEEVSLSVVEPSTKKIVGRVSYDQLRDVEDEAALISSLRLKQPVFTFENLHMFEIARQMIHHDVRLMPVIDDTETYIGTVEKRDLLEKLPQMLNLGREGSVITVEMVQEDFTLTELVNLVELEGAKILGLTVSPDPENPSLIQVSIKLNLQDTSAVTLSLSRHGYTTIAENRGDLLQMDMTSRADELTRYFDF